MLQLSVLCFILLSSTTLPDARSSRSAQKATALLAVGIQQLEQARYEQAIEAFRQALELDPTLLIGRYDLGVAYFSLNRFDEARKAFQEVLNQNPGHRFAAYFLARLELVRDNVEGAIQRFKALSKGEPVADEFYYLGSAYLRKGDLPEAVRALEKATVLKPNDYRVALLLAGAYRKTGQSELAAAQVARSEQARGAYRRKSQEILQCNVALNSQPTQSALERCRQLLEGVDSTKLVSLGVLLAEHQLFDQAISPLAKAALLDSENYEPQFNLGLTYFRMKNYREARKPLERAVALRPESYDALALLGSTLFALGEDYPAAEHLRHAHQLRPTDEKVKSLLFEQLRMIAQHLLARRNYQEAVPYFKEALTLKEESPELQEQLAQATAALESSRPPEPTGRKEP